jgi:hypothetical protein
MYTRRNTGRRSDKRRCATIREKQSKQVDRRRKDSENKEKTSVLVTGTVTHFMNDICCDSLEIYLIVYLDHILMFSKSEEEHVGHVKEVLK